MIAVMVMVAVSASLEAVNIWTVGVDNKARLEQLRKIREFIVDDKIDVTPLVCSSRRGSTDASARLPIVP
jgi:hypothetical protein